MPTLRNPLTKKDEDFIRKNYLSMHDSQIIRHLKTENSRVSGYFLQQFRYENNLIKKNPNKARVVKMEGEFFDSSSHDNWLV